MAPLVWNVKLNHVLFSPSLQLIVHALVDQLTVITIETVTLSSRQFGQNGCTGIHRGKSESTRTSTYGPSQTLWDTSSSSSSPDRHNACGMSSASSSPGFLVSGTQPLASSASPTSSPSSSSCAVCTSCCTTNGLMPSERRPRQSIVHCPLEARARPWPHHQADGLLLWKQVAPLDHRQGRLQELLAAHRCWLPLPSTPSPQRHISPNTG